MTKLDPRTTPYRDKEIAASHLQGQVLALEFVDGEVVRAGAGISPLMRMPIDDKTPNNARMDSQLLFGELFSIYEWKNG
jgi:hypothetical protein